MKEEKKFKDMWFLAKAVAIYFSKKTEFDSINNDRSNKFTYF